MVPFAALAPDAPCTLDKPDQCCRRALESSWVEVELAVRNKRYGSNNVAFVEVELIL